MFTISLVEILDDVEVVAVEADFTELALFLNFALVPVKVRVRKINQFHHTLLIGQMSGEIISGLSFICGPIFLKGTI